MQWAEELLSATLKKRSQYSFVYTVAEVCRFATVLIALVGQINQKPVVFEV